MARALAESDAESTIDRHKEATMRNVIRKVCAAAVVLGVFAAVAAGPAAACDKDSKTDTQASTTTTNNGK
jgi:hypothetical protein